MIIKVCGLNQLENINQLSGLAIDYYGMIFYPKSLRYVEAVNLNSFIPNTKKVGVFVNACLEEISTKQAQYGFQTVQLHGSENNDLAIALKNKGLTVWKAFGIHDDFDFNLLHQYPDVDVFVLDTYTKDHGGSGKKFNWELLHKQSIPKDFLLSGGISMNDIPLIKKFNSKHFIGIDVNSKFEVCPGIKDIQLVTELVKQIKNEYV